MNDTPFPPFPTPGERLAPSHASADTIVLLSRRRSATAITMAEPGPTPAQRDRLLGIAARVPDHGKLAPWRFIVFEGEARARFGKTLGEVYADTHPDATDAQIRFESERLTRAPLVVAVISNVVEKHKVPEWEQILSSGAVCQNLLIGEFVRGEAVPGVWLALSAGGTLAIGLLLALFAATMFNRPRVVFAGS